LKNQDPLNPLDNAEVTTQMAEISTVSGIDRLNTTLRMLVGSIGESQSMQAAALIGREVLVEGNTLEWSAGVAHGGFELGAAADAVTVKGRVVQQVSHHLCVQQRLARPVGDSPTGARVGAP
jgi:flagellar basal-body rod modification protein FlgD